MDRSTGLVFLLVFLGFLAGYFFGAVIPYSIDTAPISPDSERIIVPYQSGTHQGEFDVYAFQTVYKGTKYNCFILYTGEGDPSISCPEVR